MKSKDVLAVLSSKGIELKSSASMNAAQFDLMFNAITLDNQIDNIGNYLDGVTRIPSKKKAEPAAEVKAEETKPAAEVKKAEPAAEVKETVKEAPKAEVKAEAKPEKKEESKAAVNAPKEAPKEQKSFEKKPEQKGIEKKPEQKPFERNDKKPEQRAEQKPFDRNDKKPEQKPFEKNDKKFEQKAEQKPAERKPEPRKIAPTDGQKLDERFGRVAPTTPQNPPRQQNDRGGRFGNNNNGQQRGNFGGQNRPQQGGQQRGGFGGGFGGGQMRDKEDNQRSAPRETFKPQVIVRGQTAKGTESTPKQRGATRVVDMRGSSVDLSKYDERLDNFVPDSVVDARGGNQKVKKQAQNAQQKGGFGGKGKDKFKGKKSTAPVTKAPTSVTLPDEIMVSDLASKLKVTSAEVVKRLMLLGMMVTVNQTVDYDTAAIVADELGISATREVVVTIEEKLFDEEEDSDDNLIGRAPVVCVMGHVDHGKTSILDAIRHTNVTTGEAGGITQHIGAYRVKAQGQDITFLDTPGHEAFTAMRARGAQATDIAILVVAADDGIMPQTVEAINHAKAAGIDIIVAINKMDKPTANPDAVKQELTKYDLVPEEWGGDVICVPVSALTGYGISDLLENVLLVAEVKELKANPKRRAKGIVIEAKLDKGRGPVATVLVQNGTLRNGDIVIAGTSVGHVRAMTDHNGRILKEAGPSVPVEIIGLGEVPSSGDEFNVVADERMARELADQRREKAKEEVFKANARANLNDLFAQISEGVKQLNVIVKADVGGSAEAVKQSLEKISNEEVKVCVIHAAAGGIREGDVTFAAASNAIIVGFNVRPDKVAIDSAERQNVDIRTYRVIYDCINEITDAMKGMLAPEFKEVLLGHAEVRQTIHVPNVGTIAGSYVQDGKVTRAAMISTSVYT